MSMASYKTLVPCLVAVVLLFIVGMSEAYEFQVGGRRGVWKLPSSSDEFNQWSQKLRFLIGDAIVLKYDAKEDSVLQVSEDHYKACNTSNPIKSYGDGSTRILLDRSGPFYFISGAQGHCERGQKLFVWVLSSKRGTHSHSPAGAPAAPSPAEEGHPLAPGPAPSANSGARLAGALVGGGAAVIGVLAMI